jgi:hypothetical protein
MGAENHLEVQDQKGNWNKLKFDQEQKPMSPLATLVVGGMQAGAGGIKSILGRAGRMFGGGE